MSYSELKDSLENKDRIKAATIISQLYLIDEDNFRKSILLRGCLPDPLNDYNFAKKEYIIDTFYAACELVAEVMEGNGIESKRFKKIYYSLIFPYIAISNHNKSNVKRLTNNEFLKLPYDRQLQTFCVYLENQSRLTDNIVSGQMSENKLYTGMEMDIAIEIEEGREKQSLSDNIEAGIEVANTLFRYIFYLSKNNLDAEEIIIHEDVCPYELPSFEEVSLLTQHRNIIEFLWEKIKFSNWDFEAHNTQDGNVLFFKPPDEEKYKLQRTAIERYRYKDYVDYNQKDKNKLKKSLNKIQEISGKIILDDIKTLFSIDKKIIDEISGGFQLFIETSSIYLEYSIDFWFEDISIGKEKNIKIGDLLETIKYFYIVAFIYQEKSHKDFDDNSRELYRFLAPIVEIDLIIEHFSNVSGIEINKASEIVNLFIFKPN